MRQLRIQRDKSLRLTNVLAYKVLIAEDKTFDLELEIERMSTYIKTRGTLQIGPLIQYTSTKIDDSGEVNVEITFMLQCKDFIHSVQYPYKMHSVIRVSNCIYCRYVGPENKLSFAYDKINIVAFEEDIILKGASYTIFVDESEENETITADVFMERAD